VCSPSALLRVCALSITALLCANIASAQFDDLNGLASQITKQLKPLKPHLVAVVDFHAPDGSAMPQGHYFAWILSSYLEERGKNKFAVANHVNFDRDLANLNISPSALVPGEALQSTAPHLGADVLITGAIERRDNSYFLQVTPIRVSDGKSLFSISQSIEMNDFMESFVTPFPPNIRHTGVRGGSQVTSMPSCIHCPDPSYNDLARSKRVQGTCVMEVLISESGQARQIRPVKLLGYGLDERAFDVIKKWRFKPATIDGTPVATIVPIDVTFRLF
jgi:TonB family protein